MVLVLNNGTASEIPDANQYTGEKTGGEFKHWKLFGTDPSAFVRESYGVLSSRCATLYHTSAIARAVVNKPLTYSIGKGLFFKSLPDADYLGISAKKAKAWGRQFTKLLHYEKKAVKWYKKQKQLAREAKITGDSLLYFVREGKGRPFDLITVNGDQIDWECSDGRFTLGIQHDQYGRRLGFKSKTTGKTVPFTDKDGNQNAIQFLFTDRAGQLRGFSVFSSEIARSKNLDRLWDAMLERMVQEAMQLGYFNASNTDVNQQAKQMAKDATGTYGDSEMSLREISPRGIPQKVGGMYVLENEESMTINDLKTPSNNFGLANEWIVNYFAMATNIPPEVIMSKYATSYTAHKGAFNDFLKIIEEDRQMFIDNVESVINLEYLKHFVRTGQIQVKDEFWTDEKVQMAYLEGVYLGPVPGHINPLQEVNADAKAVAEGFTLRSNIAAKHGLDFWNSVDEWEEEQDRWYNASPDKKAEALFNEEKAKVEAQQNNQNNQPRTSKDGEED